MSIARKMKFQVWVKASSDQVNTHDFETPFDAMLWVMCLPDECGYTITGRQGNGGITAISVYNDAVDRNIKPFAETGKPSCVIPLTHKQRFEREVPPQER